PQLTSVLSIANRISGVITSLAAVGLVVWLLAAAAGPQTYVTMQGVLAPPPGQAGLFIRHFRLFPAPVWRDPPPCLGCRLRL
ncbi:MAG TPA: hypothetical protein VFM10_12025, partial [Terriglobales bacterium]|nr:hypothetical protein [Terriglobales bacterium]